MTFLPESDFKLITKTNIYDQKDQDSSPQDKSHEHFNDKIHWCLHGHIVAFELNVKLVLRKWKH